MKSIFKGKHIKDYYGFDNWEKRTCMNYSKVEKWETILEIDLKDPPLNSKDRFYNLENEEIYFIENAMRSSTDDTMVYLVDKVLSETDDEESLQRANTRREEYLNKISPKVEVKEDEQLQEYKEEQNNKKWWQKLFK